MATAAHRVEGDDRNAAVLADADLAIIGASPEVYRSYLEQVRAEYAWVDDASWRAGRSRLLDDFLGRPRLYVTEPAFVTLEEPARAEPCDGSGRRLAEDVSCPAKCSRSQPPS